MSTAAITKIGMAETVEQVVINGDLSKLTAPERLSYYRAVCDSLGLNPLTKPFDYIQLNGKLTLYAKRDATDQLRKLHAVSIVGIDSKTISEVFIVTARAKDRDGREDSSTGAVNIANLKGDNLANALMKAETKAKRRVTLSICGLGLLDETEVETIPTEPVSQSQPKENGNGKKPLAKAAKKPEPKQERPPQARIPVEVIDVQQTKSSKGLEVLIDTGAKLYCFDNRQMGEKDKLFDLLKGSKDKKVIFVTETKFTADKREFVNIVGVLQIGDREWLEDGTPVLRREAATSVREPGDEDIS